MIPLIPLACIAGSIISGSIIVAVAAYELRNIVKGTIIKILKKDI
jgi:hypothetical protein